MLLANVPLWFLLLFSLCLGAIWGSFAGALASRWPKGETIVAGRSACDNCGVNIAVYDLVPIFSYIVLRGKCRHCRMPIGAGAIGVELASALIGVISFLLLPVEQAVAAALFGWLLVPLAVLDYRHLWLPDSLVLALAVAGAFAGTLLMPEIGWVDRVIGGAAGFLTLETLRLTYRTLRRQEGMGAGDPKLFAALGVWLGWQLLPQILLLASMLGLAFALVARLVAARHRAALPLGSYLAASALLVAWLA